MKPVFGGFEKRLKFIKMGEIVKSGDRPFFTMFTFGQLYFNSNLGNITGTFFLLSSSFIPGKGEPLAPSSWYRYPDPNQTFTPFCENLATYYRDSSENKQITNFNRKKQLITRNKLLISNTYRVARKKRDKFFHPLRKKEGSSIKYVLRQTEALDHKQLLKPPFLKKLTPKHFFESFLRTFWSLLHIFATWYFHTTTNWSIIIHNSGCKHARLEN